MFTCDAELYKYGLEKDEKEWKKTLEFRSKKGYLGEFKQDLYF